MNIWLMLFSLVDVLWLMFLWSMLCSLVDVSLVDVDALFG
jgi:hypothetical protein